MKLAEISIKRPVFATVMVSVLLVFGLVAYPRIGVDLFPEIEFPFVTITAVYPGADPETIESKVVDKLEEAVNAVNGIKMLRSTSAENVGIVVIQFELERKADQAVQDVRDKVAAILRDLPADLDPPVIEKFDVGAAPIMALAVSGDLPIGELTRITDDVIKESLQTISGVGGIDLVGGQDREFHVWIDPRGIEAHGLAVDDVVKALQTQNVEIPGGRLEEGPQEFVIKTRGQVHSAAELADIIISSADGAMIKVGDVARVEDGVEEKRSFSDFNGRSAVALVIRKQSGSNTVQVAQVVKKRLADLEPLLPQGVTVAIPTDNSTFIEHAIGDVQFDLAFGAVLAVLIILFFLHDWRATVISGLAIPTSVIATFGFINVMGFTFNNMTMLGLSLSIGILIDDAIVVIENIHRHLEMGKPPMRAAAEASDEIGLAVMATTASIVAVFVPVATMKGIIGRFFLQFGLTVAFAVSVSLFVAFTLTPMLSARFLKLQHGEKFRLSKGIERFLGAIDGFYRGVLAWGLAHRLWTMMIATVIFFASIALGKFVPFEFLPPEDRGEFKVTVELPTGTSLPLTEKFVLHVAEDLRKVPGVDSTFTTVGGGTEEEINRGEIQVNLVGRDRRDFSQDEAINYVRSRLADQVGAVFSVERINAVGGNSAFRAAMIQFNVRGRDYDEINQVTDRIIEYMRSAGGFVDIDTTYRGGKPELQVRIDRKRAADLGVPIASLAATIRTLFAGEKASEIVTDGDRYDVRVRLDEEFRKSAEELVALKARSVSGELIPLANIVEAHKSSGPAKIERQNRRRQVTILANLEDKALGDAMAEIDKAAADIVPATMASSWTGQGDAMRESAGYMGTALLLAVILVYLILAAQFESFVHPLTIMMALPLSMIGALGGLLVAGHSLNIFSMIGVIMLMGLVTKNAILLVDYTNVLRTRGKSRHEALLEAGPVRLRPILMTTAAMIFGMIPVALALSEGGEQRAPMAVAVIGGLITSTALTLVVVPVVYSLLDQAAEFASRRFSRRSGKTPVDSAASKGTTHG